MKVIFMGTPDFSVPILDALAREHEIVAVYCQPPRPAGRGKNPRPSPVQIHAEKLGLPVRYPSSLKTQESQNEYNDLGADIAVVVAYGLILPQEILDTPRLGCLNIHASLLPRWRGAAPIQRAIMAGDTETGICIMQMDAGLDTGPVLMRKTIAIAPTDTSQTLHDKLSVLGAALIAKTITNISTLSPTAQSPDGMTYAKKINKAEAKIDWNEPAQTLDNLIRGISPFPGAWFEFDDERVKILLSERSHKTGAAGHVLDDELLVACGEGSVRLLRVQKAGKAAQDAAQFLLGTRIPSGTILN